jgi:ABC-type microcin C transport system permease subunit YejB
MGHYLVQRLLLAAPVVVGIPLITFLIKAAAPTDAVTAMLPGSDVGLDRAISAGM